LYVNFDITSIDLAALARAVVECQPLFTHLRVRGIYHRELEGGDGSGLLMQHYEDEVAKLECANQGHHSRAVAVETGTDCGRPVATCPDGTDVGAVGGCTGFSRVAANPWHLDQNTTAKTL
jgi:hypothetical protein